MFKYCIYLAFSGAICIGCIFLYFSRDLPNLNNLKTEIRTPGVIIQTYDGNIIGSYGDLYEDVVKIESLPEYVPIAFMAIEDKRFFQHFGIDFIGFTRAIYQNYISHRVVQGGSTITQQLAKNILITEGVVTHYDRSIKRKIKELLLAFWLEHKFSKSEIMMMYLNRVYFGAGTYGIDAASRKYFNKPATKLSVFEAAILAGVLKAPTKYNPSNHPNYAYDRAMTVLKAMQEQGYIKSAKEIEKEQAKAAFENNQNSKRNYMYFCDYAYDQAKKILGEIEDDIIIVTTFNESKQQAAEKAVDYYLKNEGSNYKFTQASFICLGRDGAIQALIGGNGYSATQFNRAVQANRLPGSAFKIFIYGAALEYGYQIDDMISDEPVEIAGWKPKN
ncbi:MAG: transglycosylase domain-containing protein, partial [Alphaproteobacteria bacterium]|nr:transglycosylase domain-containing protein [Alphaproteobacteria bacterium]